MAGGREIKTKIKSVQNTRKVTRALEMVSASKIRKAQERMKGSRPYARLMTQLIGHIAKANSEYTHPFMADPAFSFSDLADADGNGFPSEPALVVVDLANMRIAASQEGYSGLGAELFEDLLR